MHYNSNQITWIFYLRIIQSLLYHTAFIGFCIPPVRSGGVHITALVLGEHVLPE